MAGGWRSDVNRWLKPTVYHQNLGCNMALTYPEMGIMGSLRCILLCIFEHRHFNLFASMLQNIVDICLHTADYA
jgi:hypothetical protein